MPLDASLLRRAVSGFAGKSISEDDAASLAAMLDNREEMLAYLVLRTDFLILHADVEEAFAQAASEGGYDASTNRKVDGLSAASRKTISELSDYVASIVLLNSQSADVVTRIAAIDQMIVKFAGSGGQSISPDRWIKSWQGPGPE